MEECIKLYYLKIPDMNSLYRIFALIPACFLYLSSFSQELVENKIDEFTKASVKGTSYEVAVQKKSLTLFVRISKIDSTEFLDIKMMTGNQKIYSILSGMELMIMLDNSEILHFKNLKNVVSCKGCAARGSLGNDVFGIETSYELNDYNHEKLKSATVKKLRIYTGDGFLETEINDQHSKVFAELLPLVE